MDAYNTYLTHTHQAADDEEPRGEARVDLGGAEEGLEDEPDEGADAEVEALCCISVVG